MAGQMFCLSTSSRCKHGRHRAAPMSIHSATYRTGWVSGGQALASAGALSLWLSEAVSGISIRRNSLKELPALIPSPPQTSGRWTTWLHLRLNLCI